jgi:hypothetical protein
VYGVPANLRLRHSGAITPGEVAGDVLFEGKDSLGNNIVMARIRAFPNDMTAGTVDAQINLVVYVNGVATTVLGISPNVNIMAGVLQVAGVQVIGAQGGAVANPAGGVTIDAEARTALIALLGRNRAHGLIAA